MPGYYHMVQRNRKVRETIIPNKGSFIKLTLSYRAIRRYHHRYRYKSSLRVLFDAKRHNSIKRNKKRFNPTNMVSVNSDYYFGGLGSVI